MALIQHQLQPLKQSRAIRQVGKVEFEELLAQGFKLDIFRVNIESRLDQAHRAIGDTGANRRIRQRGAVVASQLQIQGGNKVRRCIQQCPIQIKKQSLKIEHSLSPSAGPVRQVCGRRLNS